MELSTTVKAGLSRPDGGAETRTLPSSIPVAAALVIAVLTSVWLRQVDTRADAGNVVFWVIPWALAAFAALRCRLPSIWAVVSAAVLMRAVFVGAPPWLSDDLFRYLAEGHALNHGENPFVVPPAQMASISDALRAQVNHPDLTTLYPPIALAWFCGLDLMGGTPTVAQLATGLLDVSIVLAIARLADTRWAMVYALHPLGPLEAGLGAHIDVLAVALMAWAVVLIPKRPGGATLLVVVGAGVKLFPAILLPALLMRRDTKPVVVGALIGAMLCGLAAWPVVDAGPALLGTLRTYSAAWSFNGLGYSLFQPLAPGWARLLLAAIGAVVYAIALWRCPDERVLWSVVGAAFVFITPTAHPWYALWAVVPFLLRGRGSWLAGATALLGSYAVLWSLASPAGWTEAWWLLPATWGPALVLIALVTWMQGPARPMPQPQ